MNGLILDAMYAKYQAAKADAVAKLHVYLTNSAGIGEHPDITAEIDEIIEQYASAEDKRQSLNHMIANIKNFDAIIGNQDLKQLLKD
tara:strand:+ start:56 stop:316 length:261 start_codon:yes stop_codon:yes gene_type:complete